MPASFTNSTIPFLCITTIWGALFTIAAYLSLLSLSSASILIIDVISSKHSILSLIWLNSSFSTAILFKAYLIWQSFVTILLLIFINGDSIALRHNSQPSIPTSCNTHEHSLPITSASVWPVISSAILFHLIIFLSLSTERTALGTVLKSNSAYSACSLSCFSSLFLSAISLATPISPATFPCSSKKGVFTISVSIVLPSSKTKLPSYFCALPVKNISRSLFW